MIDLQLIGSRIKEQRTTLSMTQEVLAEKVGTSIEHLSRIENGHANVSLEMLDRLCCALDIDLGTLFTGVSITKGSYQNSEIVTYFSQLKPELKRTVLDFVKALSSL